MALPDIQPYLAALKSDPQIFIAVVGALWLGWLLLSRLNQAWKSSALTALPADGFPPIEPLPDFDWKNTEPEKLRPFLGREGRYNLTMAIESLSPSELILFDNTYKDRLALRTSLLKSHPETVVGIHDDGSDPRIADAVCEYYTFVLGTYLPTRYPNVFNLHRTELVDGSKNHMLENRATGELWPITLTDSKGANGKRSRTRKALENLLRVVDEDILFLLPESSSSGDEKYHLKAYAVAFPSGFDTTKKLGLPLSAIHGPVPGYKDKLERSMDRFFGKLEPGKYVKRSNWTITAGDELFAAFGALHGSEDEGMKELRAEDLDVDSTLLRCERQTVHRLPKSGANVFAFHTYTYPLKEIKEEGLGEELTMAIDGLKGGNVPQMHVYKRAAAWGPAVKEYLRS